LTSRLRLARQSRRKSQLGFVSVGLFFLAVLSGCAKGRPVVGPIQFVNSQGSPVSAVNSLSVNGAIYLVATVTNDDEQLGVSWTVNCGSLPPGGGTDGSIDTVCGVFDPAETSSGPVPTYPSTGIIATYTAPSEIPKGNSVTITAHAAALPSVTSSVTLTIVSASQAIGRIRS
jgi:hypothetical protein